MKQPLGRSKWLARGVAGLVGVAALQWTYFVAIDRLPVGMALLLEYQAPILVAVWARVVQKEQVRSRMWVGLALGWCVVMTIMMPFWHLRGKQNSTGEGYATMSIGTPTGDGLTKASHFARPLHCALVGYFRIA